MKSKSFTNIFFQFFSPQVQNILKPIFFVLLPVFSLFSRSWINSYTISNVVFHHVITLQYFVFPSALYYSYTQRYLYLSITSMFICTSTSANLQCTTDKLLKLLAPHVIVNISKSKYGLKST